MWPTKDQAFCKLEILSWYSLRAFSVGKRCDKLDCERCQSYIYQMLICQGIALLSVWPHPSCPNGGGRHRRGIAAASLCQAGTEWHATPAPENQYTNNSFKAIGDIVVHYSQLEGTRGG